MITVGHLHYFLSHTKLELYKRKTTEEKERKMRHVLSLGREQKGKVKMDGGGIYVTLYMISSSAFPIVYINKLSVSIVHLKL